MKNLKKIFAMVIACVMMLAMGTMAFAQTEGAAAEGKGSITISNAARGETYSVYKLFDATNSAAQTGDVSDSIAYTGTIPESLKVYFAADDQGNITATEAAKSGDSLTADAVAALSNWAKTQTATKSTESDGSALTFAGLDYGYYVVTTTQGNTAISVTSTNPNASVVDKNATEPIKTPKKYAGEEADTDNNVNIGDTVTYTISFGTANYDGSGDQAKQITSYVISDDFASGVLTDVNVTSIKIGDTEYKVNDQVPQFDDEKKITIPWVDNDGANLYKNGANIVITYTATVADTAAIDGEGNKNTATITYTTTDSGYTPDEKKVSDTIYTFAIALKKVDQSGKNLAGAKFKSPFYVKADKDTDGAYIYAGTEAKDGLVNEITTPADGLIIVKGVKDGKYSITETEAPKGYNKLTAPVEVTAVKTGKTTTSTTTYLDKDGNVAEQKTEGGSEVTVSIDQLAATAVVAVNKTGAELPSTGGMGTTIFYVLGAILVLGAGVVLVTRRRMRAE